MEKEIRDFMRAAMRIPRLSADEELYCIKAWQRGCDHASANRIVESHLRFVVAIALKVHNGRSVCDCSEGCLGDLIMEGALGLWTALDRFDASRGLRFVTYASFWARAFFKEFLRRCCRPSRGYPWDISQPTDPETKCIRRDTERRVRDLVRRSPLRDREILLLRYFVDPPVIRPEIGKMLGITKERVRQIEKRAKERMKPALVGLSGGLG